MRTLKLNDWKGKLELDKIRPAWFLISGILLMTLTHLTWNVDLLAWVSVVPFLLYLNRTNSWKSRLAFSLILILTWSIIVFKIVTDPIPIYIIPMYSVPIALIQLPGYLLYGWMKSKKLAIFVFPAVMISLEWLQYTFTPFASWGIAAYTQVDSLNIAQSISIFGMAGLSFLIYWINTSLAHILIAKKSTVLNTFLPLLVMVFFGIYGHLRLDIARTKGKEVIKVAAVGTDSQIGGLPLPEFESNEKVIEGIFKRTITAANADAKMVVWNEASFYLMPENEAEWKDSIANLAREYGVGITASYVVPVSEAPFRYENKLVLFGPDGKILNEYLKHQPVPGEPAIKGEEEIVSAELFGISFGGAICYDYDFPYLAGRNKKAGAEIVALPSSDWRGIDPLHTKMAAFRAIEQGHSIIRSTRFGLSATINPYGEMVAQLSSFDENGRVLISSLPTKGVRTVYSVIGDAFVYLNFGFLLMVLVYSVQNLTGTSNPEMRASGS
jgi:apolipoprotein N-acyltransferase